VVAAGVLALAAGACERRAAQSGADTAAGAAHIAPPPPAALTAALSAGEQAAIARIPAGAGHDIVVANCLICHGPSLIEQQHKDTTGWNKTVTQMVAWGAPLPPAEQPILVAYLAQHYGGRAAGPPARPAP
jgi:cytochrome c5